MSELLKINVNDHTEKKNGLTYLSWAWAWAEVLKVGPQATWNPMFNGPQGSESPWFTLPDGSMLVGVSVAIKGHAKSCMLPVMDHRNKAIKNPDAFAVNTALMRCLAKCIAMHGLGLYIYAGEDLPEDDKPEQRGKPANDAGGVISGPSEAYKALKEEVQEWVDYISNDIENLAANGHVDAARSMYVERTADEDPGLKAAIWSKLSSKTRSAIKAAA